MSIKDRVASLRRSSSTFDLLSGRDTRRDSYSNELDDKTTQNGRDYSMDQKTSRVRGDSVEDDVLVNGEVPGEHRRSSLVNSIRSPSMERSSVVSDGMEARAKRFSSVDRYATTSS